MKPIDPYAIVKECKGAALSILVLLATNQQLGGGAVTQEWLERHSGYTDKPVSQALAYLSETGRITRTSTGWMLSDSSLVPRALRAVYSKPAFGSPGAARAAGDEEVREKHTSAEKPVNTPGPQADALNEIEPQLPEGNQTGRKLSDSLTTTSAIDPDQDSILAEEEAQGAGMIPTQANLEHVDGNLATFKKWGVGRNEKTIVLSARPEVTPEQIEAIARRLIGEKRFSTGLLITAVQSGDQPVPNLPNKYTPRAKERDPDKYADWEQ